MAKRPGGKGSKRPRTKEESQAQKHRTAKNQVARYSKLIATRPSASHAKVWKTKLEKHEAVLI